MSTDATIRPAQSRDADALYRINLDALGYDFPLELTRERLSTVLATGRDRLFVAELNGDIVGYIHCADYDCIYQPPLKNILALAVMEKVRGRGVGKLLLTAAEDWARECGCKGVRLVSGFNRMGALGFYLACGYTDRKNQKNFIKYF